MGIARTKDALQLVSGRDLELIVAAVLRSFVGTPAHEVRRMPESSALHVVVGDLDDALGPKRFPAQVLAAIPPARGAGHSLPLRVRFFHCFGPVAPGMTFESVLAQRRELIDKLLAHRVGERSGDTDVVQRALVVIETEEQRSDHRARALLVPAEAGDYA